MKKFALTLIAVAAVSLVGAFAYANCGACPGDKAADSTAKASDCSHAKMVKAGDSGCPHAAKAKAKTASGCAKDAATCSGCSKDAATCAQLKTASGCGGCGMDCASAKNTEVAFTGRVLCEHCNLHKADSCKTVFQKDGEDDYVSICPGSDIDGLKQASDHGKKLLKVKGHTCVDKDGNEQIMIESWTADASV
jgi:hypothetical protein